MTVKQPPFIEVPWRYIAEDGVNRCFYLGNKPEACVIHISGGWRSTAVQWATVGHYGASWGHYICLNGDILRHLQKNQGGFHAGVSKMRGNVRRPYPTWVGFKGWEEDGHPNVNVYTDSIEMEGQGEFTEAQKVSLKWLCQWLAQDRGYAYVRENFPPHADIDLIDRPNDFGTPTYREEIYKYLFQDEEDALKLTELQTENLLLRLFAGSEFDGVETREQRLERALRELDKCATTQSLNDTSQSAIALATSGSSGPLPKHTHAVPSTSTGQAIKA